MFDLGWLNAGYNKIARSLHPAYPNIWITDLVRLGVYTALVRSPFSGDWTIEGGWAATFGRPFPFGWPVEPP